MPYDIDENNEENAASQEAIRTHLEQAVQNGIQLIRDYIIDADEAWVKVVEETKFNKDIHNVVVFTSEEPNPLSFITLFEQDFKSSEIVADQIRELLVSCGFEIVNEDGSPWLYKNSDRMTEMFDFISAEHDVNISSEYVSSDESPHWLISLTSVNGKSIELLRLEKVSERSAGSVERQLAMFLAAMDKTVEVSDGSKINIYGYVLSPLDV
jgi:hypothetical protein